MGANNDRMAVLDSELRVRGINGLRVLDASSMPGINRGHTMAPTLYIAERGCDLIKGQAA
jgi:choline dehydrogenase-like flavoprotein